MSIPCLKECRRFATGSMGRVWSQAIDDCRQTDQMRKQINKVFFRSKRCFSDRQGVLFRDNSSVQIIDCLRSVSQNFSTTRHGSPLRKSLSCVGCFVYEQKKSTFELRVLFAISLIITYSLASFRNDTVYASDRGVRPQPRSHPAA